MAKKSTLYNIYNDLVKAVKPVVGNKNVFLMDRPKITDTDAPMEKFIVVSLPVSISDYVIGRKKSYLLTSGVFYLFTQARSNETLDVNPMGDLTDSVINLFPIDGEYIVASKPVVRLEGSDGMGFQVTTITFDVQGKWKAFENNSINT